MFGLRSYPDPPGGGTAPGIEEIALDAPGAKLDLELDLQPTSDGGVDLTVVYTARLFDRDTIERMTRHYLAVLVGAIASPETCVSQIDLLAFDEQSRQAVLRAGPPAVQAEARSVHELVATRAATRPDAVAVRCGETELSYSELVRRAGCLAAELAAAGVEAGDLVAVLASRSEQLVVALLGVLWRGATYLPLDPALPRARLDSMVARAQPSALVCDVVSAHAADLGLPLVTLGPPPREAILMDPAPVAPDDLAYVIFTSGSTGTPKGVMIEHRSILNLLASVALRPGFRSGQVLLAVTTPTFDASLFELLVPLVCGGTVDVATEEVARDPWLLASAIGRRQVDLVSAVPSLWRMLLDSGWQGDPTLVAVSTGEELTADLAGALHPKVGELWNLYGPTETTIWSSIHRVARGEDPVPLGTPVANTILTVRDRNLRPVPLGIPGELMIGGSGLARGYIGQPDLTAERFVEDPEGEGRLYRTGDLVRHRADGAPEYLGRLDHQIKLRGYRIEPGDIEHALATHPAVTSAVVARRGEGADAGLVAYVQASDPPDVSELRRHLGERLPAYMIPGFFVVLPALPLTPSGKVDRRRLPAPEAPRRDAAGRARQWTRTERRMAELWREVLDLPAIPGPGEGFFDLGGHSLLAVELFVQVRRRFGVDLPLAQIFESPTLAGLAGAVDSVRRSPGRSSSRSPVLLTEGPADGPTVFFVPGITGTAIELRWLAAEVTGEATLYGLEAPGHRRGERPVRTVEHRARLHLASLESLGIPRPLVVGGNSYGALVAYELATMLEEHGERPDRLVLVDSWGPLEREHRRGLNWKGRTIDAVLPPVQRMVRDRRLRPNAADRLDRVVRVSRASAARYEPARRYHGATALVVTEDRAGISDDPLLGWSEHLLGGIERVMLDRGHYGVLADERVVVVARLCSQRLPTGAPSSDAAPEGTRPAIS